MNNLLPITLTRQLQANINHQSYSKLLYWIGLAYKHFTCQSQVKALWNLQVQPIRTTNDTDSQRPLSLADFLLTTNTQLSNELFELRKTVTANIIEINNTNMTIVSLESDLQNQKKYLKGLWQTNKWTWFGQRKIVNVTRQTLKQHRTNLKKLQLKQKKLQASYNQLKFNSQDIIIALKLLHQASVFISSQNNDRQANSLNTYFNQQTTNYNLLHRVRFKWFHWIQKIIFWWQSRKVSQSLDAHITNSEVNDSQDKLPTTANINKKVVRSFNDKESIQQTSSEKNIQRIHNHNIPSQPHKAKYTPTKMASKYFTKAVQPLDLDNMKQDRHGHLNAEKTNADVGVTLSYTQEEIEKAVQETTETVEQQQTIDINDLQKSALTNLTNAIPDQSEVLRIESDDCQAGLEIRNKIREVICHFIKENYSSPQ